MTNVAFFRSAEIVGALLFASHFVASSRRSRSAAILVGCALIYGLLLEQLNQSIFHSYAYGEHFTIWVADCPLIVGCIWAFILTGSMRLTDALPIAKRARPACDALLTVFLDFAIDAVAVRLRLWSWSGYSLHEGWFGVPGSNFAGWIFVQLVFSAAVRANWWPARIREEWKLLVLPSACFVGQLLAIVAFASLLRPVGRSAELLGAASLAAVLALVVRRGWGGEERRAAERRAADRSLLQLAVIERCVIHAAFLVSLPFVTEAKSLLPLACTGLGAVVLEAALHRQRRGAIEVPDSAPDAALTRVPGRPSRGSVLDVSLSRRLTPCVMAPSPRPSAGEIELNRRAGRNVSTS